MIKMPTSNSLTNTGRLVNDPSWLFTKITLENPEATITFEYGIIGDLITDHFGFLLMRRGTTLGEMDSFIEKRNPKVTVVCTETEEESVYIYKDGNWVTIFLS